MSDFTVDWAALLFVCLLGLAFFGLHKWSLRFSRPKIYFSQTESIEEKNLGARAKMTSLPRMLDFATLILFAAAFIDPHYFVKRDRPVSSESRAPQEGIALYLVLDHSGSMGGQVHAVSPEGRYERTSKLDFLKEVAKDFVNMRPNDLIGLVSFARSAHVLSPLTLDHQNILKELNDLKVVQNKENEGTAIGYAIYKTANLISATRHFAMELQSRGEPAYTIKNAAIVLVTDGIQETNPQDLWNELRTIDIEDAAKFAKLNNVRLYIINVEPKIGSDAFGPWRRLMTRAADLTGGKFYFVDNPQGLKQIFQSINTLEKSALPTSFSKEDMPDVYKRVSFSFYFIFFGLMTFFISVVLRTLVMRRVP